MIALILLALGLMIVLEGLAHLLALSLFGWVFKRLFSSVRRTIGVLVAVTGLICVWAAFQFGLTL